MNAEPSIAALPDMAPVVIWSVPEPDRVRCAALVDGDRVAEFVQWLEERYAATDFTYATEPMLRTLVRWSQPK